MKNTIVTLIAIISLLSCHPIDKSDYLVYVEPATISRAVLIEDFTGQKCLNCPYATEIIEQLIKEYGEENVIAVGIHSLPLGFEGNAKNIGLMNDEGKAYGEHWNVNSQPTGLINRKGGLRDRAEWATLVYDEIQTTAPLSIDIMPSNQVGDSVDVLVNVKAIEDIKANLQLWVTEDSIVALQTMPDGVNNREYVHNHVFRACVNGMWGDTITVANNKTEQRHFNVKLAEGWKKENCSVVAFVYNEDGVLQACKQRIY